MKKSLAVLFLFVSWTAINAAELVSLEIEFREFWNNQPESSIVADFDRVGLVLGKDNHVFLGNASFSLLPIVTDNNTLQIRTDIYSLPPRIKSLFKQIQLKKTQSIEVARLPGKEGRSYKILFENWQISDQKIECQEDPFDTSLWASDFSTHFNFHYLKNSQADYYWNYCKNYLENEFDRMRRLYDVYPITKLEFYYHNCLYPQSDWNEELGLALFPAQKEGRILFGPEGKTITWPHFQQIMLLNQWGYGPLFLTYGMSGFFTLNHYYTRKNLEAGYFIPLDSLFNSASYRRQNQEAAYYESASLVRFLIEKSTPHNLGAFYKEVSEINFKEKFQEYFGDLKQVEEEWLKYVREYYPIAEDLHHFARLAVGFRNYQEALQLYLEMEQGYPEHQTTDDLANIYYLLGDYTQALKIYQEWVKQDSIRPARHLILGNMYWITGNISSASAEYEKTLSLDSSLVLAYVNLAKINLDSANYPRCQSLLQKADALPADPLDLLEHYLTRTELHQALGQSVLADSTSLRARTVARQILSKNPYEGFPYLLVGRAYLVSDSLEQALKYLKVAELMEDRAYYVGQTHLYLGQLYLKMGDKEEGGRHLQTVLDLPSGYREKRLAGKLLSQM